MIFDTEAQKQKVIELIGEVPINTNILGLASGLSPELSDLLQALHQGVVVPTETQVDLLLAHEKGEDDPPPEGETEP